MLGVRSVTRSCGESAFSHLEHLGYRFNLTRLVWSPIRFLYRRMFGLSVPAR